ncbi:unnamed protein product [Cunninghamella blakesleeana]
MIPVYDIYTRITQDIYQNITEEEMIHLGKRRFFDQVNECFRDGVEKCTGLKFDFEKIQDYQREHYCSFWETCDTLVSFTHPNGPAILEIYEIPYLLDSKKEEEKDTSHNINKDDNDDNDNQSKPSSPLKKILVYSLPKSKDSF